MESDDSNSSYRLIDLDASPSNSGLQGNISSQEGVERVEEDCGEAIPAKKSRPSFISMVDWVEAGTSGSSTPNKSVSSDYDEISRINDFITSNENVPEDPSQNYGVEYSTEADLLDALRSDDEEGSDDVEQDLEPRDSNEDFFIEDDLENLEGSHEDASENNENVCPNVPQGQNQWSTTNPGQERPPFDENNCGIKEQGFRGRNPQDFFFLLFTVELIKMIVDKTNKNAKDLLEKASKAQSRILRWREVTIEEFKIFLGILFHMGTIQMPQISDYWKTHYLFSNKIFSQFMSRNRFLLILRTLHFEDPNATGRLKKIAPLLDYFNKRMSEVYYPGEKLCIDESLILWRGRLIFKQYMKGKGPQYGIKLYIVAEASGLVLKIHIYSGAGDEEVGGRDHVKKVVNKLMETFEQKGHRLFMDNYYNSTGLSEELLNKNIFVTGTLRKNRKGNPPEVINKKLKKGESFTQYSQKGIAVTKFNDRREVFMISSDIGGETLRKNTRSGVVEQPKVVAEYNKYMGGIDLNDQLLSYYHFERKTIRWYKKVGIHIFEQFLANSFKLFNKQQQKKISLYEFKMKVVEFLLPKPPEPAPVSFTVHLPEFCPKTDRTKRRRCKVCWEKNKVRKQSIYYCKLCPKQPGLCLTPCFKEHHNY